MTDATIARQAAEAVQPLPIGTVLSGDQFTITGHLGAGGFGITYRAQDNVLGRTVVIKECYYEDFCFRDGKSVVARSKSYAKPIRSIVSMFMREARSLAKLRHPNIVGVHRAFEENDTAYMVLDLIDGDDLFNIIADPPSPRRISGILIQLLDAIEKVHELDLLHRDISPDNILIEKTGTPVLIDFGAARAEASRHTRAVSSLLVVKDGYSPHEFYVSGSEQTPSSDLYALAATFYHVLSGEAPPNSQTRMVEIAGRKTDPCIPLAGRIDGYDTAFLEAIDTAMQIHPADRLRSAAKWKSIIADVPAQTAKSDVKPQVSSQGISLELERSLTGLVEETNDEVRRTSQIPAVPKSVFAVPEKPSKPAWIEEFNQESLAQAATPAVKDDERDCVSDLHPEASDRSSVGTDNIMYITQAPGFEQSVRIDRALATPNPKGVCSESESQLEMLVTEARARVSAPSSQTRAMTKNSATAKAAPLENKATAKKLPVRLVAGLLVCFGLVFFFESI